MLTENMIITHMLITVGEGSVSALSAHPSVGTARSILDTEDLSFQGRGWWFNKERDIKLVQNEFGQVEVPANTLAVTVSNIDRKTPIEKLRYVKRGQFMYDAIKHTNVINTDLYATLTLRLPIEDLPLAASNYLKHRAAELMYIADDGDNFKSDKLSSYRAEAWQLLKAQELTTLGANALDNYIGQSVSQYDAALRIGLYGGGQR